MKKNEIKRAITTARKAFAATDAAVAYAGKGREVDLVPAIVGMDVMAEYALGLLEGEFPAEVDPNRLVRKLVGAWLNHMADRGEFDEWEAEDDE